jgi:hypothetical protein
MRATETRSSRTPGRLVAALLAAGLALGFGGPSATAADPPPPPTLVVVEASGPQKLVISGATATGGEGMLRSVRVNLYQGGEFIDGVDIKPNPGPLLFEIGSPAPSSWAVLLRPNTRYCVGLMTYVDVNDPSTYSEESSRLCATTAPPPATAPDLQFTQLIQVEQAGGVAGCVSGDRNNVRVVIKNGSESDGAGTFAMQLVVDQQPGPTTTVGGVPAKSDTTYYFGNVSLTKGLHTLQVRLDIEDQVPEFKEDNNTSPPLTVVCEDPPPGRARAAPWRSQRAQPGPLTTR